MSGDGAGAGAGAGCICCHASRVLKFLLGALILVCFVSSNALIKASAAGMLIPPHGRKVLVSNRRVDLSHDFIVVSKRRVPNGPDPIHNRRVGESRRPPGRA